MLLISTKSGPRTFVVADRDNSDINLNYPLVRYAADWYQSSIECWKRNSQFAAERLKLYIILCGVQYVAKPVQPPPLFELFL